MMLAVLYPLHQLKNSKSHHREYVAIMLPHIGIIMSTQEYIYVQARLSIKTKPEKSNAGNTYIIGQVFFFENATTLLLLLQ